MSSAGGGGPVGYAFVKRVRRGDYSAESFVEVPLHESDTVSRLVLRSCEVCAWGVGASQIQLYLVRAGGRSSPSSEEIACALTHACLEVCFQLKEADVVNGCWLVALVPDPVAPGAYFRESFLMIDTKIGRAHV